MSSANFSRMVKWPTIILTLPRVLAYSFGWDFPEAVRLIIDTVDSLCPFGLELGEGLADAFLAAIAGAPNPGGLPDFSGDVLIVSNLIVTACVALNLFIYLYVIMRFADYRLTGNAIGPSMRDLDKYQSRQTAIQAAASRPQTGPDADSGFWSGLKRSSALARIETELKAFEPETINQPLALRRGVTLRLNLRKYAADRLRTMLEDRNGQKRPPAAELIGFLSGLENCLCRVEDGVIAVYGAESGKQVYAGKTENVISYLQQVRRIIDESAVKLMA